MRPKGVSPCCPSFVPTPATTWWAIRPVLRPNGRRVRGRAAEAGGPGRRFDRDLPESVNRCERGRRWQGEGPELSAPDTERGLGTLPRSGGRGQLLGPPEIAKSVEGIVYLRGSACNVRHPPKPVQRPGRFIPSRTQFIPFSDSSGHTGVLEIRRTTGVVQALPDADHPDSNSIIFLSGMSYTLG